MNRMGNRDRDNQRQRLYTAENILSGKRVSKAALKHLIDTEHSWHGKYPTPAAVQAYVDEVTSSRWFQSRWGQKRIEYWAGNGSHASGNHITVATEHRRSEAVILHELAHCLVTQRSSTAAWHGPEFAGVLMTLVRNVMGKESADALTESFRKHKVRKNTRLVPATGSKPVVTKTERTERQKARDEKDQQMALTLSRRDEAGESIRAAVKAGYYGPPGSKPRAQALATARTLEKPGLYAHSSATGVTRVSRPSSAAAKRGGKR